MSTQDYEIIKGETFTVYHIWYDMDGNANDLTGYSGVMHIYDKAEALLETIALTANSDGEIEGSADSSDWPVGSYSYYMRLTAPSGTVKDLITGRVCVE